MLDCTVDHTLDALSASCSSYTVRAQLNPNQNWLQSTPTCSLHCRVDHLLQRALRLLYLHIDTSHRLLNSTCSSCMLSCCSSLVSRNSSLVSCQMPWLCCVHCCHVTCQLGGWRCTWSCRGRSSRGWAVCWSSRGGSHGREDGNTLEDCRLHHRLDDKRPCSHLAGWWSRQLQHDI